MSERAIQPRDPSAPLPNLVAPSSQRRKAQKVSTACERCRSKRIRCDGERPICRSCQSLGLDDCNYGRTDGRRNSPLRRELQQLRLERDKLRHELEMARLALDAQRLQGFTPSQPVSLARQAAGYGGQDTYRAYSSSSDPLASLRAMDFPVAGSDQQPYDDNNSPATASSSSAAAAPASGIDLRDPFNMQDDDYRRRATSQSPDTSSSQDTDMTNSPTTSSSRRPLPNAPTPRKHRDASDTSVPQETGPEHVAGVVRFNQSVLDAQSYMGDPEPVDGQLDVHVSILISVHGWQDTQRLVDLDRRWLDLQMGFEPCLLHMPWASRIAVILLGRWTLRYYGNYGPHGARLLPLLPAFLQPRPSQLALRHPPWVDYVPWPGFRERFVFEPARYCSNHCFELYMANYLFEWNQPADDTIVKDTRTGLLRLTDKYMSSLASIDSHRMGPDFFTAYPELQTDAAKAPPRGGEDPAETYFPGAGIHSVAPTDAEIRGLVEEIRGSDPPEGSINLRRSDGEPES